MPFGGRRLKEASKGNDKYTSFGRRNRRTATGSRNFVVKEETPSTNLTVRQQKDDGKETNPLPSLEERRRTSADASETEVENENSKTVDQIQRHVPTLGNNVIPRSIIVPVVIELVLKEDQETCERSGDSVKKIVPVKISNNDDNEVSPETQEHRGRRQRIRDKSRRRTQTPEESRNIKRPEDQLRWRKRGVPRAQRAPIRPIKEVDKTLGLPLPAEQRLPSPTRIQPEESIKTTDDRDEILIEKEFENLYSCVCKLSKSDIQRKAKFVKEVVENEILEKIYMLDERFTFEILHAGSYYEHLKVTMADEFDIMVKMNAKKISDLFQIRVCPARARHLTGFAYLEYQSHYDKDKLWKNLLMDGPPDMKPSTLVLSPLLLLDHFLNLLSRRMRQIASRFPGIKCFRPNVHGPAVTLSFQLSDGEILDVDVVLCMQLKWPSIANNWGVFSMKWPGKETVDEIKMKGCHVVPKINTTDPRCWRLSFSLAEKLLLSPKPIQEDKKYYRILKYIYEFHKLEPLCSYHLKTLFLHLRSSGQLQRQIGHEGNCIKDVLVFLIQELIEKVEKKRLQHFFIGHNLNLFCDLNDEDACRINSCLRQILRKFGDASSLRKLIQELKR